MAKQIPVSATVETTTQAVSVTAAPGSAGISVPLAVESSSVTLTNTSIACALQYKVNSGTWVKLGRDDGAELIVNLQVDTLYLRRATLDGGLATASLSIASKPGSTDVLVGAAVLGVESRQISAVNSVVTLGDSFVYYGNDALGDHTSSTIAWVNDLMRANGNPGFDVIQNLGANGKTLQEIIAQQLPNALASAARIAWVHAGINNLNAAAANNDPLSTIMAQYKLLIAPLAAAKDLVVVEGLSPIAQSGNTGSKVRAFQHPTVNSMLKQYCASFANVRYLNAYTPILDTASAVLNPVANALNATDGIHLIGNGAYLIGYSEYQELADVSLIRYKSRGANLLPAFAGTGGTVTPGGFVTVTGSPPPGWELLGVSGAAATHSVTISSVAPDMIRLVFANSGATAAVTQLKVGGLQASVSAGRVFQAAFGFQASALAALGRLGVTMVVNGAASFNGMVPNFTIEPTAVYPQVNHGGFRSTPPWTIPAGAVTSFDYVIQVQVQPGGTATIDLYAPELRELT